MPATLIDNGRPGPTSQVGPKSNFREAASNKASTEAKKEMVVEGYPQTTGCFMRMPSGCHNHAKKTHLWRHDVWAEEESVTKQQCMARKQYWDEYCGTTDVKMVYVAPPVVVKDFKTATEEKKDTVVDGFPEHPGCFVRFPTGCPYHLKKSHLWRHDVWAEDKKSTRSQCLMRKDYWEEYCGARDVKMMYIPRPSEGTAEFQTQAEEKKEMVINGYPHHPGCFVRMPSGCPNEFKKSRLWRHDVWAEEMNATEGQCQFRKHYWDKLCGTEDVKVLYIPPPSEDEERKDTVIDGYPQRPGCFMRMPTGCNNHFKKTHFWRHDADVEGINMTKGLCLIRKQYWDKYCGTTDVKMLYIPQPIEVKEPHAELEERKAWVLDGEPTHHGCFMRMLTGCPYHFKKTHLWRHDVWAEEMGVTQIGCQMRKTYWDWYCGTKDVRMMYIGAPAENEPHRANQSALLE
jgi:hypothetical protein